MNLKKILILGVNGFIGHHLTHRILESTDWQVFGMDMASDRVEEWRDHPRFKFFEGDITINREWVEYHVKKCDVILPLVAIATPKTYVQDPLRVFALDFEANLPIIRQCVKYGKRVLFPSTSEVYGMCTDAAFDPYESSLILGPIPKQRWIYSCSKQLLDRVIWAHGVRDGLDFTLFRPFNWIGPGLDSINTPKEGSSRVVTQFLGQIVRGENITLVDGGKRKRAYTYVTDGIDALIRMIENKDGVASGRIYNIGHPDNQYSVRELAEMMLEIANGIPEYRESAKGVNLVEVSADDYYGAGYQDVEFRIPDVSATQSELGWEPSIGMREALERIFDAYRGDVAAARELVAEDHETGVSDRH